MRLERFLASEEIQDATRLEDGSWFVATASQYGQVAADGTASWNPYPSELSWLTQEERGAVGQCALTDRCTDQLVVVKVQRYLLVFDRRERRWIARLGRVNRYSTHHAISRDGSILVECGDHFNLDHSYCRWQSETDPSGSRNLTHPAATA